MHILACVKRTPPSTGVQIDSQSGKVKTDGVDMAINPFDEYAVEEALRLKERVPGSTVSVLTAGPPEAHDVLRDALARGCDTAYHLCDERFADSDTYAVAYILSMGIKKISGEKGPVHLVICGKQTNDGATGNVGPGIAAWLGWPAVTFVRKVDQAGENSMVVHRMMEDGYDVLEVPYPALITVLKEINEPRLASLKGKMAARKASITRWTAEDIGLDKSKLGREGSPTTILKLSYPPSRKGGVRIEGKAAHEKAKTLVDKLTEMKLL